MPTLISPSYAITNIRWLDRSPGLRTKVDAVYIRSGLILIRFATGAHWTNALGRYAYPPNQRSARLIDALFKIGSIKKQDYDLHMAKVRELEERSELRFAARDLARMEKKYGKGLRKLRQINRNRNAKS